MSPICRVGDTVTMDGKEWTVISAGLLDGTLTLVAGSSMTINECRAACGLGPIEETAYVTRVPSISEGNRMAANRQALFTDIPPDAATGMLLADLLHPDALADIERVKNGAGSRVKREGR